MDRLIIWSPEALVDLEAIGEFIARDSEFYAQTTVQKIFEASKSLTQHPKAGRIVPEFSNDLIRELFVFQYRIIYEISENEIHILTIIHGKRILDT